MPEEKEDYIYRILDANFNRASEGLRVIEEIARFVLEDVELVGRLKETRHKLNQMAKNLSLPLLKFRESEKDVGADLTLDSESRREDLHSLLEANFRRSQEALRVLEEFAKLLDKETACSLKFLRFKVYSLEKEVSHEWTQMKARKRVV